MQLDSHAASIALHRVQRCAEHVRDDLERRALADFAAGGTEWQALNERHQASRAAVNDVRQGCEIARLAAGLSTVYDREPLRSADSLDVLDDALATLGQLHETRWHPWNYPRDRAWRDGLDVAREAVCKLRETVLP